MSAFYLLLIFYQNKLYKTVNKINIANEPILNNGEVLKEDLVISIPLGSSAPFRCK